MRSAVILPVTLPEPLEVFRQAHVDEAPLGVPAHATLLFPFVPVADLTGAHETRLAATVAATPAFDYRLETIERWPETLYVRPGPTQPFAGLADRLAADWPEWPLYGDGTPFDAHITLGEPRNEEEEAALRHLAQSCLPARRTAGEILLIAEDEHRRWHVRRRFQLAGRPAR
jgi:2'-5' RNA ligase